MKVKNIVFSGAMASILMIGAAVAADKTDVTFAGKFSTTAGEFAGDVSSPISEPVKSDSAYNYTNPDGDSVGLDTEGTDDIVRSDYVDTSSASVEPDADGVSVKDTELVSGMTIQASNYQYAFGDETLELKVNEAGTAAIANHEFTKSVNLLPQEHSDAIAVTKSTIVATNGSAEDVSARMFIISDSGQEYSLALNDSSDVILVKKGTNEEVSPTGNLDSLFTEAKGYYSAAVTNVGNAKTDTENSVSAELTKANKAFAKYSEDKSKLSALDTNWNSLVTAKQAYIKASNDFNASEQALSIYNAPILGTVDNEADSRIELALNEGGAIRTAIDEGDAATLSSARAYADAGDAKLRNDIVALDSKVNDLDENLSAGIASSVALSSVAVSNVKQGEMSVGGGYGNYNSKSAMAFGAALGITDNWSANAGVGFGFGKDTKASFRIGTNYKFKLF